MTLTTTHSKINLFFLSVFLLLIAVGAALGRCVVFQRRLESGFLQIGTHDYIQLWTAYRLFTIDRNFYDPELIGPLQYQLGWSELMPLSVWYPPWLITLMAPVLAISSFLSSAWVWGVINVSLFVSSMRLLCALYWRDEEIPLPPVILSLAFLPVIQCLDLGQTSLLNLFSLSLFLWSASRKNNLLMALAFVLLSIKPHPLYLIHFCAAAWILSQKNWRLVVYFLAIFSTLLGLTFLISPNAVSNWIISFSDPPLYWVAVTLVGFVRLSWSLSTGGSVINWPMWAIPLSMILGLAYCYRGRISELDWLTLAPPLVALSVFTAPYGFFYDHAVVVVSLFGIFKRSVCQKQPFLWKGLLLLLLLVAAVRSTGVPDQLFFWLPLAILIFWSRAVRVSWGTKNSLRRASTSFC